jgi:hypothetical protein
MSQKSTHIPSQYIKGHNDMPGIVQGRGGDGKEEETNRIT